jgi:hypothetical protein
MTMTAPGQELYLKLETPYPEVKQNFSELN